MAAIATQPTRREEILDAALDVFLERGYWATRIGDIQRASGASIGSIYHHFGDKAGIATALYVEVLSDYQEGLLALLAEDRPARDGIRAMVVHHVDWSTRRPRLARYLLEAPATGFSPQATAEVRALNRRMFAALRRWLAPRVERGEIRDLDLGLCAALVLGPSHEVLRHWLSGASRTHPRKLRDELANAAWRALAP